MTKTRWRILACSFVVAVVVGFPLLTQTAYAAPSRSMRPAGTWACASNCWAIGTFSGIQQGGATFMTVYGVTCSGCQYNQGQLRYALWDSEGFMGDGGAHWAAIGYETWEPTTVYNLRYYWEDNRPTYSYRELGLAVVPSGDFGKGDVTRVWYLGSNSWYLYIDSYTLGVLEDQSDNNVMLTNQIDPGAQLTGTSSRSTIHGGSSTFTDNQWYKYSTGVWAYQTVAGTPVSDNPPIWGWNPKPDKTNFGGTGTAYCAC